MLENKTIKNKFSATSKRRKRARKVAFYRNEIDEAKRFHWPRNQIVIFSEKTVSERSRDLCPRVEKQIESGKRNSPFPKRQIVGFKLCCETTGPIAIPGGLISPTPENTWHYCHCYYSAIAGKKVVVYDRAINEF